MSHHPREHTVGDKAELKEEVIQATKEGRLMESETVVVLFGLAALEEVAVVRAATVLPPPAALPSASKRESRGPASHQF